MAEIITINDSNAHLFCDNKAVVDGVRRYNTYNGMFPTERERQSVKDFSQLLEVPLIPRDEWDDRIREGEKNGTTEDYIRQSRMKVLNQQNTSYCWAFATVFAFMVVRLIETLTEERMSGASVAAPVKNFANVGGWGYQALDYMAKHGVNLIADWPETSRNRAYYNAENREKAKQNLVLEYYRLDSWDEVMSCLLCGVVVSGGHDWWRHQVLHVTPMLGERTKIGNSWGTGWSDEGWGILEGRRRIPDGACAVVATRPV